MTKFSQWFHEELAEYATDIAKHGADCGYPGISYYKDTVAVYDEHEQEIWDALADDAEAMGYDSAISLIGSFGGAGNVQTDEQFKNLLVWYMCEREAAHYFDED